MDFCSSFKEDKGMSQDQDLQEKCVEKFRLVREALHKEIVGMDRVIDVLFWTLLAKGHALFVGVPGLAKTKLIASMAQLVGLDFNRIQFTPDMMPSDIIGGEVLEEDQKSGKRVFEFRKGPLFCQMLLADEVNRTPPKTQSALLQAMQEGQVSFAGKTHIFKEPFVVFATQNPIESEGTYPLPEAQLDRFLFSIPIDYPNFEDEVEIVQKTTGSEEQKLEPLLDSQELIRYQSLVRQVPLEKSLVEGIVKLVRSTRPGSDASSEVRESLRYGAGPRASQAIALGAKAKTLLEGRAAVRMEDIETVAPFVLQHRLVLRRLRAESSGAIIDRLIRAGA